jgi:hypothetical protein
MKTSPVSFGRAIKVNTTPQIANMFAQAANVKYPTNDLQKFAKSIFNDTDIHKAKVVVIDPDEVYIYSGEEAKKQCEISTDLKNKIQSNEDLIKMLPNREVREQRKHQAKVENYSTLHHAIYKMRSLVEDGINCRPLSTLDISYRTHKSQFFGEYDEISNVKYSKTIKGETEKLEYNA